MHRSIPQLASIPFYIERYTYYHGSLHPMSLELGFWTLLPWTPRKTHTEGLLTNLGCTDLIETNRYIIEGISLPRYSRSIEEWRATYFALDARGSPKNHAFKHLCSLNLTLSCFVRATLIKDRLHVRMPRMACHCYDLHRPYRRY